MLTSFTKINKDCNSLYNEDLAAAKKLNVEIEGCVPYFQKYSNKGVLLVHGFAASPMELFPLAKALEQLDYSVYIVRVAGHGSNVENFISTTYNDWYKSIELGYNTLASFCEKICVVGQSNGGLLATTVAKYNKVDCLVLLAPAYKVKVFSFHLIPYIKNIIKSVPRKIKDIKYNYKVFPTKPLYEMMLLQKEVQQFASDIDVPVLLAISPKDILVSPKVAKETVDNMKSHDKTIYIYDNKEYDVKHILTEEKSEKIIKDISLWIKEKLG